MSRGAIIVSGISFFVLLGVINYFFKLLPSGTTKSAFIGAATLTIIFILAQRRENLFKL